MQHARAGRAAALLALWLLPLAAVAWPSADDTSAEAKLARWLQERGGALVRAGSPPALSPLTLPPPSVVSASDRVCGTLAAPHCAACSWRQLPPPLPQQLPNPTPPTLPQPGYALGQACPTCLRGVVASKALREDEVIIAVPQEAVLQLG